MNESHTVFISNVSRSHDYTKAARYGAIRPVTQGNYPIFKTDRLREEIISALIHSEAYDYLLLSGSSVVSGLCCAIWILLHGQVNLLLYDPKQNAYIPRIFHKDEAIMEIERERDRLERSKAG